jgi:hypothetical protein
MDENLKKRLQELAGILSESKVSDIHDKYYQDIRLDFFNDIIKADPTTPVKNGVPDKLGQYSKWLLFLFKKGKLRKEDLYKAREYLTMYHELKKQNLLPNDAKDIGKISSLPELFLLNSKFGGTGQIKDDESYLINDRYFINSGQAELFFENKRWMIVVPRTLEASKFYACTSQWCTRFPENYDSYTSQGPLYIIIDKLKLNQNDATRRYQFHFESNQFMNMNDSSINVGEFIKNNPSIAEALSGAISRYIETSHDLNDTTLSLLGAIAERNPEAVQRFMPALEERIRRGLPIPEQIIDTIPGLRDLHIRIYSEHGWTIEEKYLARMEPEERQKTIEKKLSKYGSPNVPLHYFKNAENRLKVYYYKDLVKRGWELPEPIALISDPKLVHYYIEQMSTLGKKIPSWAYNMASDAQKERYRKGLLKNKIHLIEPEQFREMSESEKRAYINKYVDDLYTFMPNKFFSALSTELKNYYISKIAQKKGSNRIPDFLTDEQYKWATTKGFL